MDPLLVTSLASSAVSTLSALAKSMTVRKTPEGVRIQFADEKGNLVELDPEVDSHQAVVRELESLATGKPTAAGTLPDVFLPPGEHEQAVARPNLESIALALTPDDFLRTAAKRTRLVFRVKLGILIALSMILLVGIAGSIVSALSGKSIWAVVFAGASIADIVGLVILKPLAAMEQALVSAQRVDLVHVRFRQQLLQCEQFEAEERFACSAKVWDRIQQDLEALGGS